MDTVKKKKEVLTGHKGQLCHFEQLVIGTEHADLLVKSPSIHGGFHHQVRSSPS